MASAPTNNLPLFYKDLMPLNTRDHGRLAQQDHGQGEMAGRPACRAADRGRIPGSAAPFPDRVLVRRQSGAAGADGPQRRGQRLRRRRRQDHRRYLSSRLPAPLSLPAGPASSPNSETMSLCFDPTSEVVGEFNEGQRCSKTGSRPNSPRACWSSARSSNRPASGPQNFVDELKKHDLLMDGEVAIQRNDEPEQPYIYRGFKMINQEKAARTARRRAAELEPERHASR